MKKSQGKARSRSRHATAPVHFEHTGHTLTSYAGLIPVIKFLDKRLNFTSLFQSCVGHERAHNAQYSLSDAVFLVMTSLIGGAKSISKCVSVWSDGVLKRIAGWSRVPDETTLGRIFKEVQATHINDMETLVHTCRSRVWQLALRAGTSNVAAKYVHWIDCDSTVKTVYGEQEGAAKGYNPHKRGALSYHPLLAFSTQTKEILQGWFRTGNAYTSNGIVEFMRQLLAHLPKNYRIFFRADSGFFVGALMEFLEGLNHSYLIKVKMIKGFEALLRSQAWGGIPGQPGWEQTEFTYQARDWNRARRMVAVRYRKPVEQSPQAELLAREDFDFFCYVTTEPLNPWQAHCIYGERATSETWIEEAKSQIGLAHLKTGEFQANAALFQSAILAYNTLRWMALLSGNEQLRRWEPQSMRIFLIRTAGQLLTGGNQMHIKLSSEHLYPEPWHDWLALA